MDLDCSTGEASFSNGVVVNGDTVIATDGAGSPVRQAMERKVEGFAASSVFLDHGYKELHIPPGGKGGFLLEQNALHIWPRHQFMMIALPNFDGSFTCTLFLDKDQLTEMATEASVEEFFKREFADAVPLMPTLVESVAEGGVLVYETFAAGNETVGKPSNPHFLLARGELLTLAVGLRIVAFEDGFLDAPARFVQRLVAVRETPGQPGAGEYQPRYML